MATAFLVVDVQNALVEALPPARRAELLDTIAALLARARDAAVRVIYVRHEDEEFVPDTHAWDIPAAIAPQSGEPIVEKRHRDAFRDTNLNDVLQGRGIDHVVVCGMQTEFCIDATIREAERRGYRVTLVGDAHATYDTDGATEAQIRAQIHRVADGSVAQIAPAAQLFTAVGA